MCKFAPAAVRGLVPAGNSPSAVLLNSHVSLDVGLLLVLLPVLSLAHPHVSRLALAQDRRERDSSLRSLYTQMQRLIIAVSIAHRPFLNTTLLFIHSGLQSYRFHFDWLQKIMENRSMTVPSVTQQISRYLRHIGQLLQKQIRDPPPSPVPPQLPVLTKNWDIHVSSIAVHRNLQRFCHWSLMALYSLMHSPL
ncbi:hypothetical protein ACEWY4_023798 [Coilia grayii]|uniref:Interleukin-11 n=1 Tax=Coilia grayii TaxID=363190 RepID=A0ABD1J0G8_9TELE